MRSSMGRLVYGVGVSDSAQGILSSDAPYYECWRGMIRRCYSKKFQEKQKTYIGCSVCDEWLIFSNFKAWMETQDWQGMDLDKDLLVKGNKIYSPETCVFVDHKINSFVNDSRAKMGDYPTGVYFKKSHGMFYASCNNPFLGRREFLGYFNCPHQAHSKWKARKHEFACIYASLVGDARLASSLRMIYSL